MKYGWQFSRADGNFKIQIVELATVLAMRFFSPESLQDVPAGSSTLNSN